LRREGQGRRKEGEGGRKREGVDKGKGVRDGGQVIVEIAQGRSMAAVETGLGLTAETD